MQTHATSAAVATRRHRPKTLTVFAAAFAAGVVLAYGVNRVMDVHVVQVEPQIESEPIFVALRSMPQGTPITVWDVALKDWPKAMLPTTALKADASLEGVVLRHPIREGQPLLSGQLVRDVGPAPGTAFVAAPVTAGPVAGDAPPPASVVAVPAVAEQFVPAMPAESAAVPQADSIPASVPTAGTMQPATAAPPAAPAASAPAAPLPVAVTAPRSTDVDEIPTITVQPTPIAAVEPPEPLPVDAPTPAALAPAATVEVDAPLAAPVPALPPTDIGRPLAAFAPKHEHQDARSESVLDRTTEATQPIATESNHKYHLVVPERIALAADASFTQQPRPVVADERLPAAEPQTPTPLPVVAPNRSNARRQPAANPAASRKAAAQQRQQPTTRPQAAPATRGFSAWMPKFMGESRQQ